MNVPSGVIITFSEKELLQLDFGILILRDYRGMGHYVTINRL